VERGEKREANAPLSTAGLLSSAPLSTGEGLGVRLKGKEMTILGYFNSF
jgi:hypothetical protein